jgi:hypothetical protein
VDSAASRPAQVPGTAAEGAWNPGLSSHVPLELRSLCTIFDPRNGFTPVASARELHQLTGFPLPDLAVLRPERLALHELMIRVMADFSVPDGPRIGDLGINFRRMIDRLLHRHVEPEFPAVLREYDRVRRLLSDTIAGALRELPRGWGPPEIATIESQAARIDGALPKAAFRSLARVLSALFAVHGRSWGTPDLIGSIATDLACNRYASEAIGGLIEPILERARRIEGYRLLPTQDHPVVINTKGPSASGKSSLRPLQKVLAGNIGVSWNDFALISPDIFRKQLLDYGTLGSAYKYAGAFTSEELQIIDRKLDRYMGAKHARCGMTHLLIDRFRFDSFAPESAEAGSNLLTRFGASVYLFFVITPPEQLVERAWTRGLEFGRYKAVDDTLAHSVEAYAGMPKIFFTWIRRTDKHIHFEMLDNSVPMGQLPRTVAFGDNYSLNILDPGGLLNIERFGRVNINATSPAQLHPDRSRLEPEKNAGFLRRCVEAFREVRFADQDRGRIYLRLRAGVPDFVDRDALENAIANPDVHAAVRLVAPGALELRQAATGIPQFLDAPAGEPTLGAWGGLIGS